MPDQTPSMPPLPEPFHAEATTFGWPDLYRANQMHAYAQAVADERVREALKLARNAITDLQSELARSDSPINGEYVAAMHFGDRARAAIRALADQLSPKAAVSTLSLERSEPK